MGLARKMEQKGITTLMVRNIPATVTQREFLGEMDRTGFKGCYDFAYMPCSFETRSTKGHAFVNFKTTQWMRIFFELWHKSDRLGSPVGGLKISPAQIQGMQE